jgi:hypothetical protein
MYTLISVSFSITFIKGLSSIRYHLAIPFTVEILVKYLKVILYEITCNYLKKYFATHFILLYIDCVFCELHCLQYLDIPWCLLPLMPRLSQHFTILGILYHLQYGFREINSIKNASKRPSCIRL